MRRFVVTSMEAKNPFEGVESRIIHGEKMTMAFFSLKPGTTIPEHAHRHEQMGTVLKGSVEIIVNNEKTTLRVGHAYHIPSDAVHGGYCSGPVELLEIFSPPREDL